MNCYSEKGLERSAQKLLRGLDYVFSVETLSWILMQLQLTTLSCLIN